MKQQKQLTFAWQNWTNGILPPNNNNDNGGPMLTDMCVCVGVCVWGEREKEREGQKLILIFKKSDIDFRHISHERK